MSKRYVIQVNVGTVESPEWVDHQFDNSGNNPWMSRSKTKALNYAVTLVMQGEERPLRIGISLPVYAVTPLPQLDVAEAVEIAKQITASMSDDGYGDPGDDDDYIAPTTVCTGCGALDNTACDCVTQTEEDTPESALDKLNETPYYLQ